MLQSQSTAIRVLDCSRPVQAHLDCCRPQAPICRVPVNSCACASAAAFASQRFGSNRRTYTADLVSCALRTTRCSACGAPPRNASPTRWCGILQEVSRAPPFVGAQQQNCVWGLCTGCSVACSGTGTAFLQACAQHSRPAGLSLSCCWLLSLAATGEQHVYGSVQRFGVQCASGRRCCASVADCRAHGDGSWTQAWDAC